MMYGFQQIVTQTERRYNFVVHGLPPLGDEMGVSPLIWRKKLMDSISGNLGYYKSCLAFVKRQYARPAPSPLGKGCVGRKRNRPPETLRRHSRARGRGVRERGQGSISTKVA